MFKRLLVCAVMAIPLSAQTYTTLVSFNSTNGSAPFGALVQGADGNFYGTTCDGGTANRGTIFKMTPAGALTTLHSFDLTDGDAGLLLAANGNFYGTTYGGGTNSNFGTIFEITPAGALTTLNELSPPDGALSFGGLVQAADGDLYGTTWGGGAGLYGTVFRMTPAGALTTLYGFDYADGAYPYDSLVQAADGTFFGTTQQGGAGVGVGTVFGITPAGVLATLHSFDQSDGQWPQAGLVQASNGNFYGATPRGGPAGKGAIFEISPQGTLTGLSDYGSPCALIEASDGDLYGVTNGGQTHGYGSIFRLTPTGALTTVHNFNSAEGIPAAALLEATDGNFYGTTNVGGSGPGTVFRLSLGLAPFVKTVPAAGPVGTPVTILGTNLAGLVSVTFNGTPAGITFRSPTEISTSVPPGATTGKIQVTTPSGTLSSNAAFLVTP